MIQKMYNNDKEQLEKKGVFVREKGGIKGRKKGQ